MFDISIVKMIIFDVDGVLLDTPRRNLEELFKIVESLKLPPPSMEIVKRAWGLNLRNFLSVVLPEVPLKVFLAERDKAGYLKDRPLRVPYVRRVLSRVSEAYLMSIVTNRLGESLEETMGAEKISLRDFWFVETASSLPPEFQKPSPKAFTRIILEAFSEGIYPEEMLYVGDNRMDMQSSRGAGLQFAAMISGFPMTREDFLKLGLLEEQILESIRDLLGMLGLSED